MGENIHRLIIDENTTRKIEKQSENDFKNFCSDQVYSGNHLYYTGGYMDGAKFALENQWNDAEKLRPQKSDVYLCCNLNHSAFLQYPFTCFYDADEYSWYTIVGTIKVKQDVTHWMYIPHVKGWIYPAKF